MFLTGRLAVTRKKSSVRTQTASLDPLRCPPLKTLKSCVSSSRNCNAENGELVQMRKIDAQALQNLAERSMDRQHAEQVLAELKLAVADTTVFTNALFAALEAHEQRVGKVNAKVHHEVTALQQKSLAAALSAQGHLDVFKSKTAAFAQSQSAMQTELKVMLQITQQTQAEIQTRVEDASALKQWRAWSAQMSQGGFWARLLWLFRGNPSGAKL